MAGTRDRDRALFEAAVAGAAPLDEAARSRVARVREPGKARAEPLMPPVTSRPIEAEPPAIGRGDARLRHKLRRGEFPVELRVDLHGLRTVEAYRALVRAVERAQESGRRCLLVVHGKGNHSEAGGVLRGALAGWLESPPLDRWVLASSPARPVDGGDGATYLLVRKR